jgi:cytochrome bd ubiquinol oxidase subunit I
VFVGSWLSGWFIIATNAWMQHPVGYSAGGEGNVKLDSFGDLLTNPWLPWQYLHNMGGAAITGAFVVAAMGAFYLLADRHHHFARMCLRVGVIAGFVLCVLQIFPSGDRQAKNVFDHQPATFAAMEGLFETSEGAPLVIIGNPDTRDRELESTIEMPKILSFLTSRNWTERVTGLNDIPEDQWPDSVPLVYYAYHIMVGLGTILLLIAGIGVLLLWRRRLYTSRPMLWTLMLAFPLTYIANIAGWTTAETGRQPWLVYGLMRTEDGASPAESVPAGTTIFTILGFAGLYVFMSFLFVVLILRIVVRGPDDGEPEPEPAAPQPEPAGAA